MFIIFGTNATQVNTGYPLAGCTCVNCRQQNCVNAYVHAKYFHIFFIPIFPLWKTTEAKCVYCPATYSSRMLTPEMRFKLEELKQIKPAKRPIWHWLGLMFLVPLFLFISISIIWSVANHESTKTEGPDYSEMLSADLDKCVSNPTKESDSISYYIKFYMDLALVDDFNEDGIKYYSRSQDGKLLILLKVDKMKSIEKETRSEFISMVRSGLEMFDIPDSNAYIGVHGRWNMCLTSSPTRQDLSGDFADSDILYPFYQKNKLEDPNKKVGNDTSTLRTMEDDSKLIEDPREKKKDSRLIIKDKE